MEKLGRIIFFEQFYLNIAWLKNNYMACRFTWKTRFLLWISVLMVLSGIRLTVTAQYKKIDSLKLVLQKDNLSDSERMELQLALAWDYFFVNVDSARIVLGHCLRLATKDSNYSRIGDTYAYLGTSYYQIDNYDSALFYYRKAETFYQRDTSEQAKVNIATNRMSMGTSLLQQGDHQTALNSYLTAIDILEKAEDYGNLVTAHANIGLVYNDLKQYDKALHYHQRALNICLSHASEIDFDRMVQVKMFMALDYLNLKQYDLAGQALFESDSMVNILGSDYLSAIFYGIQGRYYHDLNNFTGSIASFHRALHHARQSGNMFQAANAFQQLGINYFDLGAYKKSIDYLLHSIEISRKTGDKIRENKTLGYLSKAYVKIGNNDKAVDYYQQYIHLSDSLNDSENKKKINEIENRYQSQKKQDSILVLQKNSQIQQLALYKKQNQNIFIVLAASLLLLAALLAYYNLRNKHRLLKQSEELHQQQIDQLQKERRLVAMQSVIKGQEEERSRLARDLHDGVGGLLSGLKLSLSTMKGNVFLSEKNAQSFNSVLDQLDQSIAELRRVSHNMMPEALIRFGLKETLENYCENMNLSGRINVRLQTYGMERRLVQNTEIVLYRIVQELLNNVLKHADAKNVLLQLTREKNRFTLTVEDDGKGFDVEKATNNGGVGLTNVRARVEYLNGIVDIRSKPGEGTSINIMGDIE